jgi:uncharacterized protein
MLFSDYELPLDNPLSEAEYDELDDFMRSDSQPSDCMDISSLDGFLTALVVGPEEVPQSEWFPVIWGTRGGQPLFHSKKQEKRIRRLVTRFYHEVVRTFNVENGQFVPLFTYWLGEGKPQPSGMEWCTGFYLGFALRDEAWKPLCEDEEHGELLDPIFFFLDEEDRLEIAAGRDPESMREEMLGLIVPSVFGINDYWKKYLKVERERSLWRLRSVLRAGEARREEQLRCMLTDMNARHNRTLPEPPTRWLRLAASDRTGRPLPLWEWEGAPGMLQVHKLICPFCP